MSNINLSINPEKMRIYSVYEESDCVDLKISNNGGSDETVVLDIILPPDVLCQLGPVEFSHRIYEPIELESGQSRSCELYFKHEKKESELVEVQVNVKHDSGEICRKMCLYTRT
jgi:hypothetical protein